MELNGIFKAVMRKASENSPAIFTGLGIAGFITSLAMTVKASEKASDIHKEHRFDRDDLSYAMESSKDEESARIVKADIRRSYVDEAKDLAPLYGPVVAVSAISIGCILWGRKIQVDRQAAVMAAYSLSAETLSRYQAKVIEKLGEDVHSDILNDTVKDLTREHVQEDVDHQKEVIPMGLVKCYDTVTGRYFFSTREKIIEAESEINKRLINEVRVSLQEFYYAMDVEDEFYLGKCMGWDISCPWSQDSNLNVFFGPMLDDEKNPCLALHYHATIFERKV